MPQAHYLAYYELYEIPWDIPAPVRFQDSDSGSIFELGRGPYHIPHLASPKVKMRAGGATLTTVNDNYILEGGTYLRVAIPVRLPEGNTNLVLALNKSSKRLASTKCWNGATGLSTRGSAPFRGPLCPETLCKETGRKSCATSLEKSYAINYQLPWPGLCVDT